MSGTTIVVTCPTCGSVELLAHELTLVVSEAGLAEPLYYFPCPGCAHVISRPADSVIVKLLRTAGVPLKRPVNELERRPSDTTPITLDELLDFALALEGSDDALDELVE